MASALVRLAWVLLPALIGSAAGFGLAAVLRGSDWPGWVRLAVVLAGVSLVVVGAERLTRRLLPLSTLLSLSAVFEDPVPSRVRAALRGGSRRYVQQHLATSGGGEPPTDAHVAMALGLLTRLTSHDRGSRGHSERVRAFVDVLAAEMGIRGEALERLRWVALLHDVGKVAVPSVVLNKPGRLTDEEWSSIRRHPDEGGRMAEPLRPFLGGAIDGITQHHERWDGSGYPRGLVGEEIVASARIVAVADAVEVMTGVRRYRPRVGIQHAREELVSCSGSQFDPEVVRAFLAVPLGRLRRIVLPLAWVLPTMALDGVVGADGGVTDGGVTESNDVHQLPDGAALPPGAAVPDVADAHPLMADHRATNGHDADGHGAAGLENQ